MIMHNDFIIKFYNSLPSTQAEAKFLIDLGEAFHHKVIATSEQTKGRAKNIRTWSSDKGDLAATIIIKPTTPKETHPQLCYLAAIAVGNVLAKLCKGHDVRYKWVNDILLDHRKVSGILLETYRNDFILVGIGVNLISKIDNDSLHAIGVSDTGIKIEYKDFLTLLLDQFLELYNHWESFGFEKIKNMWLAKAHKLNSRVEIQIGEQTLSGIFNGIDHLGNLELKQDDKIIQVSAGEMFFKK